MLEVIIKTGKENMDIAMIHHYLSEESYWAQGISYELVENSLTHSYCVGAFLDGRQVGFGRVITDYSTFAWFADFLVLPAFQGRGIAKKMLTHILELSWSRGLRRKMLNTSDAHELYRQFQFTEPAKPGNLMEIFRPGMYVK
ncbi:acetyltransferase (GNAT) family protein [Chitinophaga dinghuensis]|uniref:Acetyltransferase (GNAT) family protein n=1 Tax=Chitinophaga dinghuensis TaxID=1539050 RepID=A0A327VZ19_9BACT|nr:GNAT family N-acetyltransferase [Chitinophaga dinghuensis]RAJ80054.1 acetyltransferase (GNAT) family protein [Chitinophaga dinghuensis]